MNTTLTYSAVSSIYAAVDRTSSKLWFDVCSYIGLRTSLIVDSSLLLSDGKSVVALAKIDDVP